MRILFLIVFVNTGLLFSQVNLEWVRNYTVQNDDGGFKDIAVDNAGNIFATGDLGTINTYPITTVKYNSAGVLLWSKTTDPANNYNDPVKIAADHSGNVYVAYRSTGFSLIKYSSSGNVIWSKLLSYGIVMEDICVDAQDNVYFTGAANNPSTSDLAYCTSKYDSSGVLKWVNYYNNPNYNYYSIPWKMKTDQNGNVYVTGQSYYAPDAYSMCTLKYNSTGSLLWVNRLDKAMPTQSIPTSLDFDNSGNVYIAGFFNYTKEYIQVVKIKPTGDTDWVKQYYECENSEGCATDLKVLDNDNIYVTGFMLVCGGYKNFCTIKYDSYGNVNWSRKLAVSGYVISSPNSMLLDSYGNAYITGYCKTFQSVYGFVCTVKYDVSGNQEWNQIYSGANTPIDVPIVIRSNDMSNFYVGTTTLDSALRGRYTMIKYSQPIGIKQISNEIPMTFNLGQNYPNPFNPSTKIKFDIPVGQRHAFDVQVKLYDVSGREVATLVNELLQPGTFEISFDASKYSSGVYFYKLTAGDYSATKKMMLVK